MNGTTFDTLSAAEALEAAGISKAHAKAIAVAIRNGHGDLATKAGIGALKAAIVRLESRIGVLDSRLNTITMGGRHPNGHHARDFRDRRGQASLSRQEKKREHQVHPGRQSEVLGG